MGWMNMNEGWTNRVNMLLRLINEKVPYEKVEKKLDEDEKEWYKDALQDLLKDENEINEERKKNGFSEIHLSYDLVEKEW